MSFLSTVTILRDEHTQMCSYLSRSDFPHCVTIPSSKLTSSAEAEQEEVLLTDAVVADAAVRRPRRAEDFAGVAVLQLDDLVVDLHVADPRRRPLARRHVPIGRLCRKQAGLAGSNARFAALLQK